jgi:hypothetical protein
MGGVWKGKVDGGEVCVYLNHRPGMEISDVEWRGSCSGEDACRRKDCVGMYVMDCVILSYTSKRTMWGACCLCG